jgi:hypothetical protein
MIFALLRQVYGGHFSAFDEFWDFLKVKGIPAEFFSYF